MEARATILGHGRKPRWGAESVRDSNWPLVLQDVRANLPQQLARGAEDGPGGPGAAGGRSASQAGSGSARGPWWAKLSVPGQQWVKNAGRRGACKRKRRAETHDEAEGGFSRTGNGEMVACWIYFPYKQPSRGGKVDTSQLSMVWSVALSPGLLTAPPPISVVLTWGDFILASLHFRNNEVPNILSHLLLFS